MGVRQRIVAQPGEGLITREHAVTVARNVGKKNGYAVAFHGSGIRDVDLIAVPWIEECAVTALALAEAIASSLPGQLQGGADKRPHGRLGFVINPAWFWGDDFWYIDLSVMARHRRRKS